MTVTIVVIFCMQLYIKCQTHLIYTKIYIVLLSCIHDRLYVSIPYGTGQKGEMGEKGMAGADGAVGARGEPGEAGANGEKGDMGDRGPQGVAGQKGEMVHIH